MTATADWITRDLSLTDQEWVRRACEIFGNPRNSRPDLTPGGWWETQLFAISWMPPFTTPSLLIRNRTNRQFGPFIGRSSILRGNPSQTLPLAERIASYQEHLAGLDDDRVTFRNLIQLHAILAP